jgi:tRNA (adenine22-N1)-methyltransferase
MARILESADLPLNGAKVCVLQPMRAADDIRKWLFEHNYPVLNDRVALEGGRYYQVFSVAQPQTMRQALPTGWPEGFFHLGYTAFASRDPLFGTLAARMLASGTRRLNTQQADALELQARQLRQILEHWEKRQ